MKGHEHRCKICKVYFECKCTIIRRGDYQCDECKEKIRLVIEKRLQRYWEWCAANKKALGESKQREENAI